MSVKGKLMAAAAESVGNSAEFTMEEEKKQETPREADDDKLLYEQIGKVDMPNSREAGFEEGGSSETTVAEEAEPKLLVEMMGGLDCRTETVIIDGDEFFEADETLIESDEESMATTQMFVDALDEARRYVAVAIMYCLAGNVKSLITLITSQSRGASKLDLSDSHQSLGRRCSHARRVEDSRLRSRIC